MGAAVPMGIGCALAKENGKVYVVTGDGSAMFQLGSLVQARAIPHMDVFVLSNGGYKSIRDSQDRWCDGRRMGDPSFGKLERWLLSALSNVVTCDEYEVNRPERRTGGDG
jgi:thiamine pyrophosphate-dependent acetolactate synthase large subunit-like protein